jgi:single-stranded-DNA-specific exonuclease
MSTKYFLPDRDADGYGLTKDLIKTLHERFKPNLIITVDCGISCPAEIEYAKSLGMDCIVTDHHSIPAETPNCICVNPKFTDQEYPFSDLCGAGVALKLVQALGGIETAAKYLDICSIATVADIVSLRDENRVIVANGVEMLNKDSLPSVTALAKSCNIWGKITSTDISFKLGPKINASGRMGNAKRGLDIILEQDPAEIEKIITSLTNYNTARQKLCNTIFDEADAMIEAGQLYKNNLIIVAKDSWESGVLGIVSARITEKYGRPSIVFGKAENVYKGSSRSIGEVNIVKTIEMFKELVTTYGGHSMAAGLSVSADMFPEFTQKITEHLNLNFSSVELSVDKLFDFTLSVDVISSQFARECELLEPFGYDNNSPVFRLEVGAVGATNLPNHPQHLKISAGDMQLMYFNGAENTEILCEDIAKDIIFEFQKSDSGKGDVRAIIKGIVPKPSCARGYALALSGVIRGRFAVLEDEKFVQVLTGLSVDREEFIKYYKAIKQVKMAKGFYDLFGKTEDLELYQFIFCATVFAELGILDIKNGRVMINTGVSTDLFRSSAYNFVREKYLTNVGVPTGVDV